MTAPAVSNGAILFTPMQTKTLRLVYTAPNGQTAVIPTHLLKPNQIKTIEQAFVKMAEKRGIGPDDDFEVNLSDLIASRGDQAEALESDDEDLQELKSVVLEAFPNIRGLKNYRKGERTHVHAELSLQKQKHHYALNHLPHERKLLERLLGDQNLPDAGPERQPILHRTENFMASECLLQQIELKLLDLKTKIETDLTEPNLPEERKAVLKSQLREVKSVHNYWKNELDRFAVQFAAFHLVHPNGAQQSAPLIEKVEQAKSLIRSVNPDYTNYRSNEEKEAEEKYAKELAVADIKDRVSFHKACKSLKIEETKRGDEHFLLDAVQELVKISQYQDIKAQSGTLKNMLESIPSLRFLQSFDEGSKNTFLDGVVESAILHATPMIDKRGAIADLPPSTSNATLIEHMNRVHPAGPQNPLFPPPPPLPPAATGFKGIQEKLQRGELIARDGKLANIADRCNQVAKSALDRVGNLVNSSQEAE